MTVQPRPWSTIIPFCISAYLGDFGVFVVPFLFFGYTYSHWGGGWATPAFSFGSRRLFLFCEHPFSLWLAFASTAHLVLLLSWFVSSSLAHFLCLAGGFTLDTGYTERETISGGQETMQKGAVDILSYCL